MDSYLEKLFGPRSVVRARDLEGAGISRGRIARLAEAGRLVRVDRGLYTLPETDVPDNAALVTAAARSEQAFFCLLTALRFHDLTTQAPSEVWIGIGHKQRPPRLEWPPLRIVRFTGAGLTDGIETHVIDGVQMRFTSAARTVVDCFKFRNRVGIDVAMEALRDVLRDRGASHDEIWAMATRFRQANVMRPYMESLA